MSEETKVENNTPSNEDVKQQNATSEKPSGKVTFNGKVFDVPKELEVEFGKTIAYNRQISKRIEQIEEQSKKYEQLLNDKNKSYEQVQEELENIRIERMNEQEKLQYENEKREKLRKKEVEELTNSLKQYEGKYKNYFLDNNLINTLSKYNITDIEDAAILLKNKYKARVENVEGMDKVLVTMNKLDEIGNAQVVDLDVNEAMKLISNEDWFYRYLPSTVKSGAGTNTQVGKSDMNGNIHVDKERYAKDSSYRQELNKLSKEKGAQLIFK